MGGCPETGLAVSSQSVRPGSEGMGVGLYSIYFSLCWKFSIIEVKKGNMVRYNQKSIYCFPNIKPHVLTVINIDNINLFELLALNTLMCLCAYTYLSFKK